MKKATVVFWMSAAAFTLGASAQSISGYIADGSCAGKMGAKTAVEGHSKCAEKCIKGGAPAVLVTPEGKVYKLDKQEIAIEHAGHKVTVSGDVTNDSIKVTSIKADPS